MFVLKSVAREWKKLSLSYIQLLSGCYMLASNKKWNLKWLQLICTFLHLISVQSVWSQKSLASCNVNLCSDWVLLLHSYTTLNPKDLQIAITYFDQIPHPSLCTIHVMLSMRISSSLKINLSWQFYFFTPLVCFTVGSCFIMKNTYWLTLHCE